MAQVKADFSMGQTALRFPGGKPSEEVRTALKNKGYRWNGRDLCWWRTGVKDADFVTWLRNYGEPKKPDGACWICKSPDGYFRNRGAASPVWCDDCNSGDIPHV